PGPPEVRAPPAPMLLPHGRRGARTARGGGVVLLEAQDRSRWGRAQMREGLALLEGALAAGRPGPYALQAAIAALHARAARAEDTDWPAIAALYGELMRVQPPPVAELKRAAAGARA